MSHFEEMKNLMNKLGIENQTVENNTAKFIDVVDSEGNKAEFSFDYEGNIINQY